MIALKAKIDIEKPPEYVYNWVVNLDNNKYCKWHPAHRFLLEQWRREYNHI